MSGAMIQPASRARELTKYAHKPVRGFGPAGWILLGLFALGVWGSIRAGSVQLFVITLVHNLLGDRAMIWLVSGWMPFAYFELFEASFGLIPLAYVLLLCHFSPRRVAWWKYTLLAVWAVTPPVLFVPAYRVLHWWYGTATPNPFALQALVSVADFVGTGTLLALIMQRRRPWAVAAAGMALGLVLRVQPFGFLLSLPALQWASALLYHGSIIGAMLWWGAIERARWRVLRSPSVCLGCGYDLAGLQPDSEGRVTCPECSHRSVDGSIP